jgi:HAMP domain-containing protein
MSITFRTGSSLITKISLAVILAQILVMAALGAYYVNRFGSRIDQRVNAQIQSPAWLINQGTLGFEAVSDSEMLGQIVGNEVIDALVIGSDRQVYYSTQESDIGRGIGEISRIDARMLDEAFGETVYGRDGDGNYVSLSPIYSAAGSAPFLAVYIKASGESINQEKNSLILVFAIGSLLASLLVSAVLILLFRTLVLSGLWRLTAAARKLGAGEFDERAAAELPISNDEIGDVGRAFKDMGLEIQKARQRLQDYSDKLEHEVTLRTSELNSKVVELERLNKAMIGRELKMIELKNELKGLAGESEVAKE